MTLFVPSYTEWMQPPPCPAPVPGIVFSSTIPSCPAQGQLWWNGSVLSMFDGAVWVSIGPAVGGLVRGVTNGSVAPPGFTGEVLNSTVSGSLAVTPPPGSAPSTLTAIILPAGDWDIQSTVNFGDITTGCFWDNMTFQLINASNSVIIGGTEINGSFTSGGLAGGVFACAMIPLSVAGAFTVSASIQVIGVSGGISGTAAYTFTTVGRRRR